MQYKKEACLLMKTYTIKLSYIVDTVYYNLEDFIEKIHGEDSAWLSEIHKRERV